MKAVVYKGNGEIALEDRPVPKILDDRDAIIKVTLFRRSWMTGMRSLK